MDVVGLVVAIGWAVSILVIGQMTRMVLDKGRSRIHASHNVDEDVDEDS